MREGLKSTWWQKLAGLSVLVGRSQQILPQVPISDEDINSGFWVVLILICLYLYCGLYKLKKEYMFVFLEETAPRHSTNKIGSKIWQEFYIVLNSLDYLVIVYMSALEGSNYYGMNYLVGDQLYLMMLMLGFVYFYNHKQSIVSNYTVIRNTVMTTVYCVIFMVYFNLDKNMITYGVVFGIFVLYIALDFFDRWINKLFEKYFGKHENVTFPQIPRLLKTRRKRVSSTMMRQLKIFPLASDHKELAIRRKKCDSVYKEFEEDSERQLQLRMKFFMIVSQVIIGIKEIEEYRIEDKTEDRKDYFDYEESSSSSEDEDDLMKSMHIAGEKDEEKVCLLEPHTSIKKKALNSKRLSFSKGSNREIRKDTLIEVNTKGPLSKKDDNGLDFGNFEIPNPHKVAPKKRPKKSAEENREMRQRMHLDDLIRQGESNEEHILKVQPNNKKKPSDLRVLHYIRVASEVILFPFTVIFWLTSPNLRTKKKGRIFWMGVALASVVIHLVLWTGLLLWIELELIRSLRIQLKWYSMLFKVQLNSVAFFEYNFQFMRGSLTNSYFMSSFQELEIFRMVYTILGLTILSFLGLANTSNLINDASIYDSFAIIIVYQVLLLVANLLKDFKSVQRITGVLMMVLYIVSVVEIIVVMRLF